MTSFDLNSITSALENPEKISSGVDFSGKSLKLDTESDAKPIVDAINACPDLQYLTLTGNTLGVAAAQAIARALEHHPELKICRWSDMFTGRMKTEIPPALSALGDGMIAAGARLAVLDLSDNAFGPIGVEGLAALLRSDVCSQLQELRLNNNGLGITGGRLLAKALAASPRRLKVFVAGRNRLENDGATALAQVFERMGSLEEVSMPQNGIYWAGVAALWAALERNPCLRAVDLNDNTVGAKGAAAAAAALPRLKNLKSLNFGDCLLKSKGAKTLAKAFKEHSVALECVDLSHNEIGREACAQLADALARSSDCLSRVVLAGNSLGGAAHKRALRDKLGDCADLSDGEEGTDSEGEEEEEEEEEESSEEENSSEGEDSATEDARHFNTVVETDVGQEITLDTSGVEEVETEVGKFLQQPSREALQRLGPSAAALIDTHLRSIKDPTDLIHAYVEATLAVSGACEGDSDSSVSLDMYTVLLERAGQQHAAAWVLANAMLRGLALIKSENKDYVPRWPLPACYACLARAMSLRAFPPALRDTLRFFIAAKMPAMEPPLRELVKANTILYEST